MLKKILFQTHWLLGITAGLILAVVGTTGAMLSFEDDILHALNRNLQDVQPSPQGALPLSELIARVQSAKPRRALTQVTLFTEPARAARVTFAPAETQRENASGAGGLASGSPQNAAPPRPGAGGEARNRARGEPWYADPYTGRLLGPAQQQRGQEFFRWVTQIHRWLAAGEIGRQELGRSIVGTATLILMVMALSGIYLRWPKNPLSWRYWLKLNFRLKGRAFLWHLHGVTGTWVFLIYLVVAATGLTWSFEWYKQGVYQLAGVPLPAPGGPGATIAAKPTDPTKEAIARAASPGKAMADANPVAAAGAEMNAVWTAFQRESGGFSTANISLPRKPGQPVEIRYLPPRPAHERAFNQMSLEPATAQVLKRENYADKTIGAKLVASIFPLHSGSFFGTAGLVVFMLAALAMPVFFVTGWMLYLSRKRIQNRQTAAVSSASKSALPEMQS